MRKKYIAELTDEERASLPALTEKGKVRARKRGSPRSCSWRMRVNRTTKLRPRPCGPLHGRAYPEKDGRTWAGVCPE